MARIRIFVTQVSAGYNIASKRSSMTSRYLAATVMVFSFPKYTSCVSCGMIVTGFMIFEILSPSANHDLLIAEQDIIFFFDGSSIMRYFVAKTPDGLPEHFVGLLYSSCLKFSQDCILEFFTVKAADFSPQRTANGKKSWLCSEAIPCRLLSLLE